MKKIKLLFCWLLLIVLIGAGIYISYLKFADKKNPIKTELPPVNTEDNQKINTALDEIVKNINNAEDLKDNEQTTINAVRKNNSIFVSYTKEEGTITYEFNYDNSYLIITINNNPENLNIFKKVYEVVNEANQKRLDNEVELSQEIEAFVEENKEYIGITKDKQEQITTYYIELNVKIESISNTNSQNETE